ncbi:MAG: hypothetical protein ONB44_10965 [candidate division KSB1 bacterium]|nr:hypothetical protein [candidate division KSB1 bacterium]MDZ7302645.1 hypothetical protein [candidate division KSB1 bacterium]MDZ7311516.1 hypothetical protein [candidate division KSB1 bacterium]
MVNIFSDLGSVAQAVVSFIKISLNSLVSIAASSSMIQWGFFYALALSAILAISGYWALRWARNRSHLTFFWVLIGGLLFRLIVFAVALVWVWKFSSLHARVFTWTLLVSYVFFQTIEMILVQRYFKRMKSPHKA